MRLLAISDLHLNHAINRTALESIGDYPDDWLIVAGDIGEKPEHLTFAMTVLTERFAKVFWTPGNHDLWCPADDVERTRGQARYDELVAICRAFTVLTPEDPYAALPAPAAGAASAPTFLCPLFCLYDYTFHPTWVTEPLVWARDAGVVCGDEWMLHPDPWPSRGDWCDARLAYTEARLLALPRECATILVSHWPLRYDLARPPRVPRFSIWCGTLRTEDWPTRFRARHVVNGHLHMRTTLVREDVTHHEVSLGYPRDWNQSRGLDWYLREIPLNDDARKSRFVPARDPFMMSPA
jgi:3',5'-cyclic AMP phosphodiesterase CpdA